MLGSVLTRGQRGVLAAADLLVPLLKLAVALYLPVLVDAERWARVSIASSRE
jgi:hypothetical protein